MSNQVVLTDKQMYHLMGMEAVVSKDPTRPTLTGVHLFMDEANDQPIDKLVAVATDSYQLAVMRISDIEFAGEFDALIPFSRLKAAVQYLRQHVRFYSKTGKKFKPTFLLEQIMDNVTISVPGIRPETQLDISPLDATFPNWRSLFPKAGDWWGGNLITEDSRIVKDKTTLPYLNAHLLKNLNQLTGQAKERTLGMVSMRPTGTGEGAELKPFLFGAVDNHRWPTVEVAYLLMPVRPPMN